MANWDEILYSPSMRTMLILSLFLTLNSFAASLRIYVIAPPREISWESPRTLLLGTLGNSALSSYALTGHIAISLEADKENDYGVKKVMTSMASLKAIQTSSTTIFDGLGLSSLYYDFKGKIDTAERTKKIIQMARKDHRLAIIDLKMSQKNTGLMMEFLSNWIAHGSFRHYRGGQIAGTGLGAGCADFVMQFMHMALHGKAPLKAWMREVYLPNVLLGSDTNWVSPLQIYNHTKWATAQDGKFFMIPDPGLIFDWIVAKNPKSRIITLAAKDIDESEVHFSSKLIDEAVFSPPYQMESPDSIKAQWKSIRVNRQNFLHLSL